MEVDDQLQDQRIGGFDCNICLDTSKDPVVTMCGHLYCWPCIYKWLSRTSTKPCPVCNSPLTFTALIPLYGRGGPSSTSTSTSDIPKRPSLTADASVLDQPHEQVSLGDVGQLGIVGGLIPWFMGSSHQSVVCYDDHYVSSGDRSAAYERWRQERLAEVSLSRVCVFLLYSVVFCLLFF